MKKMFLFLLILVLFTCTSCGIFRSTSSTDDYQTVILPHEEKVITSEVDFEYKSFEEQINSCSHIIRAKLLGITEYPNHRIYVFRFIENILGEMTEQKFCITEHYENSAGGGFSYNNLETEYSVGKEYVLMLYRTTSVYYDSDQLSLIDTCIKLDGNNIISIRRYRNESIDNIKNIAELKTFCAVSAEHNGILYGTPYITSADIDEIAKGSPYIVKATIHENLSQNTDINRDQYYCAISAQIKGETPEFIIAVLPKDAVEIGKEYYLFLDKPSADSTFYIISSKNSIYTSDNNRVRKALRRQIG